MDLETAQNNAVAKLPLLKQENGNSFNHVARTITNADGTSTSTIPGPINTEEKAQKKNDVKSRSMLLMTLPNEHQLTFNQYKDAKTLFAAIQTRFDINDATNKTQKTLLKQMYENFNASSTESLDSIFNRLQKIVSQLAILGENISQEDLNLKFLRSLSSEWNTYVVVWRNKPDLDSMSFDDLYNNFKIVEQEVKRTVTSSSNSGSQNMAFVSTPSSTNEVITANVQVSTANSSVSTASTHDNTANLSDATVYAFLANQPNGSQLVHEDLEQIHKDDLEEMDLKWQLALLSMRAIRYYRTGKKITIIGSDTAGYDKSKVECFNCHKMGHFARECRGPRNQESRARNQDSSKRTVNVEETSSKAMVAIDGAGFDWSYMADEEVPTNLALMAFSDSEAYLHAPTIDLSNSGLKEFQQPEFEGYGFKANKGVCENSLNEVKKTIDALIIEDWVFDCDEDDSNAAMPINTAAPKSFVNAAKTRPNAFQKSHSLSRRPFYQQTSHKNKNLNDKVNTAKINSVNTAKGNRVTSSVGEQGINALRSSACRQTQVHNDLDPQEKLVLLMSIMQDVLDWFFVLTFCSVVCNPHNKWSSIPHVLIARKEWLFQGKQQLFWQTVTVDIVNDGEQQLYVTVDGHTIAITEASVRRHLQLAYVDSISSLPNTEIFEQLTLMGYVSNDDKLTFQKGEHIPLFDSMLIHDQPGQGEGPTLTVESQHTPIASPTTSQPTTSQPMSSQEQPSQVPTTEPIITTSSPPLYETTIPHTTSSMPHDSPLSRGDTPLSRGETPLSRVTSLENDLKQTKNVYGKALIKLVKKVKHLEDKLQSTTERRKARMVILEDEEDLTDTLQQITPTKVSQGAEQSQESSEVHLDVLSAAKILADASRKRVKTYKSYTRRRRSTVSSRDSTAGGLFRTAEEILSTDERIAHKLNKEEMTKAAAREDQERIDFEKVLELQKQLDEREDTDDIDWNVIAKQNMAGYKMNYFKRISYDEIRPIFEEEYNKIQTLFKNDTEVEKTMTKRVAEDTLLQESFKRLRAAEASRESRVYWKIIRVGDHIKAYQTSADMLKKFDRDDLEKLWKLVKERFNTTVPTNDKEKELYMHDPLHWKLYDSCGVHHVSTERGHDIFMLVEKDYPLTKALMTVMLSNKLQVEESSEMANELLRKIFYQVNKPRS
ncbi:putative ribonuclease H-like domain-containing protein [Tanacetum coccineum]